MYSERLYQDVLEDKFLRLREQHDALKRESHTTDHQVKCLNAKLARLISEKKALFSRERTPREIELEELVHDMNSRIESLGRENVRLQQRQLLMKTQLESRNLMPRSGSGYSYVRSKVDSGLRGNRPSTGRTERSNLLGSKSMSTTCLNRVHFSTDPFVPPKSSLVCRGNGLPLNNGKPRDSPGGEPGHLEPFAISLLQEAREEIMRLEDVVVTQQMLLETMQGGSHTSKALTDKPMVQTNGHLSTSSSQQNARTVPSINNENQFVSQHVELEKPRSEDKVERHYDQNTAPKARNGDMNGANGLYSEQINKKGDDGQEFGGIANGDTRSTDVSTYLENLRKELINEQSKNAELQRQMFAKASGLGQSEEMKQRVDELEKENKILRDYFEKCLGSCLSEISSDVLSKSGLGSLSSGARN
ncbi:Protein fantom [Halotydeus destructor]|nr:Protein fantom [Halotydeus destructor]